MTSPAHVPWNAGEPGYAGDFNIVKSATLTCVGTGVSSNISSAHINIIYQFTVTPSNLDSNYTLQFHGKNARADADIIFSSGLTTGVYTFTQGGNNCPIIAVDEDGTAKIFVKILNSASVVFTLVMKILRLR